MGRAALDRGLDDYMMVRGRGGGVGVGVGFNHWQSKEIYEGARGVTSSGAHKLRGRTRAHANRQVPGRASCEGARGRM